MSALEEAYPRLRELGAELLAISPQDLEHTRQTKEELNLSFHVLSDRGNEVARRFGLMYEVTPQAREAYLDLGVNLPDFNGDDSWTLPIPATYLVDISERVDYSFVESDYTKRGEPEELIAKLEEILRDESIPT